MVGIPSILASAQQGGGFFSKMMGGGQRARGFQKILVHKDFVIADVTLTSGTTYNLVGEYAVPAQQVIHIGFGIAVNPLNQGYMYFVAKDVANAEFPGFWRISVANANTTAIDVVKEFYSTQVNGDPNDKSKMMPLPEITTYPVLQRSPKQDDRIRVEMKPDTAGKVLDYGNSTIQIPVTVYM